jgi:hypothetical protein
MVQVKQGKLYFTTLVDVTEGASVLTGTFSIRDHPVRILFDSRATHSFISESLVRKLGLHSCYTKDSFVVVTAGGRILSNTITKDVPLQLGSKTFLTNLIHLGLGGLDVILGMNWLTQQNDRNPFPYQWSYHLVPTQGRRHKSLFLCCRNHPTRRHSSSVRISRCLSRWLAWHATRHGRRICHITSARHRTYI